MNRAVVALAVGAAVCFGVGLVSAMCAMYALQGGLWIVDTDEYYAGDFEIPNPMTSLANVSIVGFAFSGLCIVGLLVIAGVRYELEKRFPRSTGSLGGGPRSE